MRSFDVIVLGLGGMGSATCYQLARRGARVLGLEERGCAHALGSSHGETRLTRKSYFGEPLYIPLLHRSEYWWQIIGQEVGRELFVRAGHLVVARAGSPTIPGNISHLAARHDVAIELVHRQDAISRLRSLHVPDDYAAYLEPGAGYLLVEACIQACCDLATRARADLRFDESVIDINAEGDCIRVTTQRTSYSAGSLIICAGPWSGSIMRELRLPLTVQRIPQTWFAGTSIHLVENGMPCFLYEIEEGTFYGAPAVQGGRVKVCGNRTPRRLVDDPSYLDRAIQPEDLHDVQRFIDRYMPSLSRDPISWSMCMCTMTPDQRPIIGKHPRHSRILFGAGFSGHGFKMAPAIGDALADLFAIGVVPAEAAFLDVHGRAGGEWFAKPSS